jgi:hypothetical protein
MHTYFKAYQPWRLGVVVSRLNRFFFLETGKIYLMATKYLHIPNYHKVYKNTIKYTKIP